MREDLEREATNLWSHLNRKDPMLLKVLMGLLSIESVLDQIFVKCLPNGTTLVSEFNHFDFRTKNEVLYAIGFSNKDLHSKIQSFSEIRNKYAHNLDYVLDEEKINDLTKGICKISEETEHKIEQLVAHICGQLAGCRDQVSLKIVKSTPVPQLNIGLEES